VIEAPDPIGSGEEVIDEMSVDVVRMVAMAPRVEGRDELLALS
jgi:hypothetical protein